MGNFLTLKKSNCKNCYKCIRHCPVKSIKFLGSQAYILDEECILCGQCYAVCPQNAKEIVDETERVKILLQGGDKVVASLAPSFVANYDGAGIESVRAALKKLGFYDAEETAIGATIVKNQYQKMLAMAEKDVIISSCCHSVNLLVQKYFPNAVKYLADIDSPMIAHCKSIKKRYPGAKTVFIGPCVAKKDEAARYSSFCDAVLTFGQLSAMLASAGVEIEATADKTEKSKTRLFPTTGGILKTMDLSSRDYEYIAIDGTENCIAALKDIESGKIHKCFIEMSACVGSCVGGPVMEKFHKSPVRDRLTVERYAGEKDFDVEEPDSSEIKKEFYPIDLNEKTPTEEEIKNILKQMGKICRADELNCGSCGYDTCREKAVAIFRGKAEISMCLPYLKDKAESFSDTIVNNTPNGLIVLNEDLEVQQLNKAAKKIMNLRSSSDVLGDDIGRVMDPQVFIDTKRNGRGFRDKKIYLAEYDKYVEATTVYDREYHIILGILRDVTDRENEKEKKNNISRQTLETADKVVDKQMRVVQEIASLLGETVAETKIALAKLKESVEDE